MASEPKKKWVQTVHTVTVDVPLGTMTKSPKEMVKVLVERNKHLDNPKASINRFLQFHINRAGSGMSEERRAAIKRAQELIRKKYEQ